MPSEVSGSTTSALLEAARDFDQPFQGQIPVQIDRARQKAAVDKLKLLLGDRAGDFVERLETLLEKRPLFPWPAETVLRMSGLIPDDGWRAIFGDFSVFYTLLECGCTYHGSVRILQCDKHALRDAVAGEG